MNPIPVRVTVMDTWDEIALNVPPTVRVADVKARALAQARVTGSADDYLIKFRGAELDEGETTVGEAGVVANGALLVMTRRRIPAKK